jgi:hypothetical protein
MACTLPPVGTASPVMGMVVFVGDFTLPLRMPEVARNVTPHFIMFCESPKA